MIWLILVPVVLIALVFGLDAFIARMYRYDRQTAQTTPEKFGIPFEDVRIPMAGDAYLEGWWIPSNPEAPALVLIHGWGRNRARMLPYIRKLHPLGYNLLSIDARGHGSSSALKRPNVGTFSEDALAAVDFIARGEVPSSGEIGVLGHSIGGGATVNAAGWDSRVKSAVALGAISHPVSVMRYGFRQHGVPDFVASFLLWYMRVRYRLDFERIAPVNNIGKAAAEIFLIHGAQDTTVPPEQAQALAAAGDPERVQLWLVPGKSHSNCTADPAFWPRVTDFLKRTLPAPGM